MKGVDYAKLHCNDEREARLTNHCPWALFLHWPYWEMHFQISISRASTLR